MPGTTQSSRGVELGSVVADQMTDEQVLVSQFPQKVEKFVVFMFTH